jgi:hypothetical protein
MEREMAGSSLVFPLELSFYEGGGKSSIWLCKFFFFLFWLGIGTGTDILLDDLEGSASVRGHPDGISRALILAGTPS